MRHYRPLALMILLLAAVSPAALHAADPMAQLRAFADDMQTFSADFEQQVIDDSGRLLESSGGTMAMQKPDRFRWHYTGDFEQLIIADGERVWVYDIELEQVNVRDQEQAAGNSPFYVLSNPENLQRDYQLEDHGEINGLHLVGLIPNNAGGEIEWVELGFRDRLLESVTIQDALGQQTRIRFTRPQLNLPLDKSAFEFAPPAGVDVIGAEELTLDLDP